MSESNLVAFEQRGLGAVLKYNQMMVPPNQRDYAWPPDLVRKLFQDLAKAINDAEEAYFLGTIVTIPSQNGSLEVVDGQQRLATTALLLAAIRDYLEGKEPYLVDSINTEFLTGIDRVRRGRVPHLRLNVDDNDLFNWFIARNPDSVKPPLTKYSHHLLNSAYEEAVKHVGNIVAPLEVKDHGDILNSWVSYLESKALIVLVRSPNGSNAYKMFETLNDRGLRTSQADLIKNHLFGRSGNRLQEVQNRWSFMRGQLETMDEEDITVTFLRHTLIAMRGFVREAAVYDAVTEHVKSEQAAVSFASVLETAANNYVAIFNSEHDKWNGYPESARRAIEVLDLLDIKPLRPLLLAVAIRMDAKEAADALGFLVSFSVRLLIASSTRSSSVEEPIAAAAHDVFSARIKSASELKQKLLDITPSDKEFQIQFETVRVSKAVFARYYLRSLEMAAKGEREPWFMPNDDKAIINLEHVLPKRPEGNWAQFSTEEADLYVNRLGNQVLMRASDNSAAKSSSFTIKRPIFAASPYVLTSQVGSLLHWDGDSINQRQKGLASLAVKAWPV